MGAELSPGAAGSVSHHVAFKSTQPGRAASDPLHVSPPCTHRPLGPESLWVDAENNSRLYLLVPEPLALRLVPQFAGEGEKKAPSVLQHPRTVHQKHSGGP